MTSRISILSFVVSFLITNSAVADKLKVITTLPDLAEIVRAVGGDDVEVDSLLNGTEDPHYMDANPSFIRQVSKADVVCVVGLELEIGWIPKILSKSGNAKVQVGGPGYCDTGSTVATLGKHTGPVDRSMGDLHPNGNPHFNLSPRALAQAADAIAASLSRVRPDAAPKFEAGKKAFQAQMDALQKKIALLLKPASQKPVMEYHQEFTYFFHLYSIRSLGSIEEKPGVPPSAARLAEIAKTAKALGVVSAFGALFTPEKHLQRFSELSGVPARKLPTMVQKRDVKFDTIEKLQLAIADAILQNMK